jgi:hypothetical protein
MHSSTVPTGTIFDASTPITRGLVAPESKQPAAAESKHVQMLPLFEQYLQRTSRKQSTIGRSYGIDAPHTAVGHGLPDDALGRGELGQAGADQIGWHLQNLRGVGEQVRLGHKAVPVVRGLGQGVLDTGRAPRGAWNRAEVKGLRRWSVVAGW